MVTSLLRTTVFVLCVLASSLAHAQDKISGAALQLDSLAKNRAQQLVYLQLSKGIYETGEDLWFKGYVLDARYNQPSDADTTLYVQLRHSLSGKLVLQEKVLIDNGFAQGHLIIRDTVPAGDYMLMAFTSGSFLDDNQEFKAFRKLRIMTRINPELGSGKKAPAPAAVAKEDFSVSFFPEGGHLVAGQMNCLAFKASKPDGTPFNFNGVLVEDGKPIDSVYTSYGGMGKVSFKPGTGKKYAIKTASSALLYQLPEIHPEGFVLRMISRNEQGMTFLVTKSGGLTAKDIVISAQVRGTVYALYKGEMKKDTLLFVLPKNKFPQGIAELTVYDQLMTPLLERLVYINLDQKINISTELSKQAYDRKDKVTLKITAADENGAPVVAHFGLSVYDGLYQNPLDFLNIISYTYLYTQIRGEVLNPDYYFDVNNKGREQALDLLLLTQGWRKYAWGSQQLKEGAKAKPLLSDNMEGKITSKTALPKMLITFTPENTGFGNPVSVAASGAFQISREQLLQTNQGYIYLKPLGNEQVSMKAKFRFAAPFYSIDSALLHKKTVHPLIAKKERFDTIRVLPNIPGLINLNEVVIKGRGNGSGHVHRDKYMAQLDSVARFSGNHDFVGQCQWLNCGSCGSGTKPVEGVAYSRFKDGRIPRHGSFNPAEVVREPYKYPKYTDEELLKLYNMHRIQGFAPTKTFYSPDYARSPEEKNMADFRNTLFWDPAIITNEHGEASITFYTSDISGKFIGNIEGVDGTGRLGQTSFQLIVNKER